MDILQLSMKLWLGVSSDKNKIHKNNNLCTGNE